MEEKFDKTAKQYRIQCKPNPFRASYEKNTKVTDTDVACSSRWTKIDLHQPGVPKQKVTVANISQNGKSLFISYNPKLSKASKKNFVAFIFVIAFQSTSNVPDDNLYTFFACFFQFIIVAVTSAPCF